MAMDSAILARTFTSGARTGLTRTTTESRRNGILRGQIARRADRDSQRDIRREVVHGGTSLRCRAVPRGQASLLIFGTPITDSALPATLRVNKRIPVKYSRMSTLCNVLPPHDFSS